MYIILTTPVAVCVIIYSIYKWIMRHSDREKEFWREQKNLHGGRGCKVYAVAKAILAFVAIAGFMFIMVSVLNGETPRLRDLTSAKFQIALLGVSFLSLTQIAFFGLIYMLKRASKCNLGKVILFFTVIGVIAAVLIAGICIAAS